MLPELSDVWQALEDRSRGLRKKIDELSAEQIRYRPGPNRWSVLQVLQHLVMAEQGMLRSEAEWRNHPLRAKLQPGEMVRIVRDILESDVPVQVPDPAMEPDGETSRDRLLTTWNRERQAMNELLQTVTRDSSGQIMFSHAAAGPLTALQMLEIAVAHLDNHRRQIDRICEEITT